MTTQPFPALLDSAPVDVCFRHRLREHATLQEVKQKIEETAREARHLLDFRHPYIVQLFGMTTMDEGPALIVERSACSLESLLHDRPLDLLFVVQIMTQVASALDYLHKRKRIYNALVPANVVLIGHVFKHNDVMPVAKLSNFSRCRADGARELRRKDIADFAALLYMLLTNESEQVVSADTGAYTASPPSFAELEFSCQAAASLIRDAWGGSLSATELVKRLNLCELALSAKGNMLHSESISDGQSLVRL